MFVGPLVPDGDFVFLQVADIGLAFEKPEKFVNDGAEMELLRRDTGESLAEIVAGLTPEDAESAGAGAITPFLAVLQNVGQKVEVGLHGEYLVEEREESSFESVICARAFAILFLLAVAALFLDVAGAGSHSLTAVPAAGFLSDLLAGKASCGISFFEAVAEFLTGEVAVHLPGALALDLELELRWRVLQENAGGGFIDFLATASGSADELFHEIFLEDPKRGHAALKSIFFIL